jgi:hypothetical protein
MQSEVVQRAAVVLKGLKPERITCPLKQPDIATAAPPPMSPDYLAALIKRSWLVVFISTPFRCFPAVLSAAEGSGTTGLSDRLPRQPGQRASDASDRGKGAYRHCHHHSQKWISSSRRQLFHNPGEIAEAGYAAARHPSTLGGRTLLRLLCWRAIWEG